MNKDIKAFISEFIGTFALVFLGSASVWFISTTPGYAGGTTVPAFAHGIAIIFAAYSIGHISGAHINPAVTIAVAIAGGISWAKAGIYIVVQILAADCGGAGAEFGAACRRGGKLRRVQLHGHIYYVHRCNVHRGDSDVLPGICGVSGCGEGQGWQLRGVGHRPHAHGQHLCSGWHYGRIVEPGALHRPSTHRGPAREHLDLHHRANPGRGGCISHLDLCANRRHRQDTAEQEHRAALVSEN